MMKTITDIRTPIALLAVVGLCSVNFASAQTEVVTIGDFAPGFQFDDSWANAYATPGQNWNFNNGAADRIGKESTGGNPDGFASNGHSNTGANSMYGVFAVDPLDLTGDATLSFDILNNSGTDLTYQYKVWYADETANGTTGGFSSLAGANLPYGGSADTLIMDGSETVLASETGWNGSAVTETITLSSIDFSSNNVASIGGLSDVNRIIIGIQFNNDTVGIDANGGIDNVSFLVAVPEPSAYALLAGLLGLSYVMVRRRK